MEFLQWCEKNFNSWHEMPSGIFDLLKCIASASPVCSYFPAFEEFQAAVDNLCNSLRIGDQTDDLLVIQNSAPIFFMVIQFLKSTNVPVELKNLIQLLKKKSMAAFPGDNIILNKNQYYQVKFYRKLDNEFMLEMSFN